MSKLIQRGAAHAMRIRSMSTSNITPEMGQKINPAQTNFGPKDANIEKWQKHFQDPLRSEVPIFRRKGPSDDMLFAGLTVFVGSIFVYNIVDFVTD